MSSYVRLQNSCLIVNIHKNQYHNISTKVETGNNIFQIEFLDYFLAAGLNSTLIEHLSQQLELYKSQVSAKTDYIANLEEDLVVKEDVIKVFSSVIKHKTELNLNIIFQGSERSY